MNRDPRRILLGVLSAGSLMLAPSAAAAAPRTYTILIERLKFGPVPAQLHKGDIVIWANHDILRHSATASNHAFDVDLPPGALKTMVLTKSGTFPFLCRYHPGMRGTLVIR